MFLKKTTGFTLSKEAKTKIFSEFCRITQRILNKTDCKYVNYDAFYIGISHLLKGSLSERAYIFKILCADSPFAEDIHLSQVTKVRNTYSINYYPTKKTKLRVSYNNNLTVKKTVF